MGLMGKYVGKSTYKYGGLWRIDGERNQITRYKHEQLRKLI
jgi:hypothetical protein